MKMSTLIETVSKKAIEPWTRSAIVEIMADSIETGDDVEVGRDTPSKVANLTDFPPFLAFLPFFCVFRSRMSWFTSNRPASQQKQKSTQGNVVSRRLGCELCHSYRVAFSFVMMSLLALLRIAPTVSSLSSSPITKQVSPPTTGATGDSFRLQGQRPIRHTTSHMSRYHNLEH
jgi:hypothetical protein